MINKRILLIISLIVCILFSISYVNAGIFEFAEDVGDENDDSTIDIDDNDGGENDSDDDLNNEPIIGKFKLEILDSISIHDMISKIEEYYGDDSDSDDDYDDWDDDYDDWDDDYDDWDDDYDDWDDDYDSDDDSLDLDDYESYEYNGNYVDDDTKEWLNDLGDYVIFNTSNDDYLIVSNSESYKIPSSDKYSSCYIECEIVEANKGPDGDFYLVKNIKVVEKVEKPKTESSKNKTVESSTKSSDDTSSSSSSDDSHPTYIGNAATGKFHSYSCRDVDKINPSNIVNLYSRDEAINGGYSPCGHCKP